uniref:hypothetical protein n=1 Tax=Streptomyces sp. H51 TaxID=3111770 RepID=UPI002D7936E9
ALTTTPMAPYVWTGDSKSTTAKAVVSASRSFPGNLVCASGSRTGEVCNARVKQTGVMTRQPNGQISGPMVYAVNEDWLATAGPGDSGGPVYQPLPDSEHFKDAVEAKGIIYAGIIGDFPCNDPSQSVCGAEFYYIDIMDALWRYDAQMALWSPY